MPALAAPWDVVIGPRAGGGDPTANEASEAPDGGFGLISNAPNPFESETTITFVLDEPGETRLEIVDVQGRLVRELVVGWTNSGQHQVVWDGSDGSGSNLPAGLYLVRMSVGSAGETMTVTKLR